jgi:hypothetical protein
MNWYNSAGTSFTILRRELILVNTTKVFIVKRRSNESASWKSRIVTADISNEIKVCYWQVFQLCFNLNRTHDSVGKALRTASQGRVNANSRERNYLLYLFSRKTYSYSLRVHLRMALIFSTKYFAIIVNKPNSPLSYLSSQRNYAFAKSREKEREKNI